MRPEQWDVIKKCARMEVVDPLPISLIIDSSWLPDHLGLSMLDYFTYPDVWLAANLKAEAQYPDVIFLPGFWAEYGMCAEPSAFGCRFTFLDNITMLAYPMLDSIDQIDTLVQPNPRQDGLMPFLLNLYRYAEPRLNGAGQVVKMVAARGPMEIAAYILGETNFFLGLKLNPEKTHKLLRMTTKLTIDWLNAQAETLDSVEGIMVLDDLVGFLGPDDYQEFGHPYFNEIFKTFDLTVKAFHNETKNPTLYPYLSDWGVNIFNFGLGIEIAEARNLVGPDVCLMGNIAPLGVLAVARPQDVALAAKYMTENHPGPGLLLSAGGSVSPGTPRENIQAMIDAARR